MDEILRYIKENSAIMQTKIYGHKRLISYVEKIGFTTDDIYIIEPNLDMDQEYIKSNIKLPSKYLSYNIPSMIIKSKYVWIYVSHLRGRLNYKLEYNLTSAGIEEVENMKFDGVTQIHNILKLFRFSPSDNVCVFTSHDFSMSAIIDFYGVPKTDIKYFYVTFQEDYRHAKKPVKDIKFVEDKTAECCIQKCNTMNKNYRIYDNILDEDQVVESDKKPVINITEDSSLSDDACDVLVVVNDNTINISHKKDIKIHISCV